jgi:hypothetical protein
VDVRRSGSFPSVGESSNEEEIKKKEKMERGEGSTTDMRGFGAS